MANTYHHGDKAKERRFKNQWRWMSTPSWWHTLFHTRPRRAEELILIRRTLCGEDDLIWPLDKKPHKYYY